MGAFRLVLQRAAASWPLLSGAFVTILVAATLIAAIPIYSDAVAGAGLERSLASAPVEERTVEVSVHVAADDYAPADARVAAALARTFTASGADVHRGGSSASFSLRGRGAGALTVFGFLDGIERQAELVSGRWPGRGVAVEAAVSEAAARALDVSTGTVVPVVSRTGEARRYDVRVSGVFRARDPGDAFWRANPLELEGVERRDFTTFGPLVVPRATFFELAAGPEEVRWRVAPTFGELEVDEVASLRRALERLEGELTSGEGASFQVDGGLAEILREAERSLLVARSGVLVPSLQLAILAAYALLFTAFLIAEERRVETALLAARGADGRRIAVVALLEGVLIAAPAVVAGPWLAAASLGILERVGPLAEIDLALDPRVGWDAYGLAAVAGVVCVAALVVPALRSQRVALAVSALGRPPSRGIVQRARLDVVLLALALLAYWQLRRYGAPLIEDAQGRLGIDPLLVAAPALGLLAGAVLALRVVPATTRLAERLGGRARGAVPPLGARQLSRRPRGYARSALLLTLALAIGLFASAFGSTWSRSQEDQAAYETGADVRVRPDERSGALPAIALPRAYEEIEGVRAAAPVVEDTFALDGPRGDLVAVDSARAASVVSLRRDLAEEPPPGLFRALEPSRPVLPGLRLPGEPTRLVLTARVALDPRVRRVGFLGGVPGLQSFAEVSPSLALLLRDRAGVLHWYRAGAFESPKPTYRFEVGLAPRRAGPAGTPAYPLELVAIELHVIAPFQVPREGTLDVQSLEVGGGSALSTVPLEEAAWSVREPELLFAQSEPRGEVGLSRGGVVLSFRTGAAELEEGEIVFRLFPGGVTPPSSLPALATEAFFDVSASRVGDVLPLELAGARRSVDLVGSLRGFPTVDRETPALVVDQRTYGELVYLARTARLQPSAWWLDTAPGRAEAVAEALRAPPFSSAEAVSRQGRAAALQNDPVALGTIGALSLGFLAAAIFAAVGFAVSSAVSARERTTEFAVVRSLGLTSRQLAGWLVLENGVLVALSLAGGTALGLLLAHFVLPTVALTQTGATPFPRPVVDIPWGTVVWLEAAMLLVLVLIIALEVRLLRRVDVAAALRAGEVR